MKDFLVLQIILVHFLFLDHVGISLFGSSIIGILLLVSHILGAFTVGIFFRFWKKGFTTYQTYKQNKSENKISNICASNFGEILSSSLKSATSTIVMIGGFVVLFSIIISIFNKCNLTYFIELFFKPICNFFNIPSTIASSLFTGIFEITNGINLIANIKLKQISINIILTSFLLGLGGISVFLQVLSLVSKSDLSIKPYIIGKILHATFSSIYTYILILIFPIFNFNL